MLNLKSVNKAIQKEFPDVELVKGDGYFYFWPTDAAQSAESFHWLETADTTSVMVNRINDLTLDQWFEELRILREEFEWAHA